MASQHLITFTSGAVSPEGLKGKGWVLVDFWAPWCGPCRMVGPIIEQIADEYHGKVSVGKLNVDDEADGARLYNVLSIPTMILFRDGEVVERVVGAHGKPALIAMLEKHLR